MKIRLCKILHVEDATIHYEVAYTYYHGSPPTLEHPGDDPEIDINAVYAVERGGPKLDITSILQLWDLQDTVTQWLWEGYESEDDLPPEESYERQAREEE